MAQTSAAASAAMGGSESQPPPAQAPPTFASFASTSTLLTTRNALIGTFVASAAAILHFRPTWATDKDGKMRWDRAAGVAGAAVALCWYLIRRWTP